jgi:hypothetical protein
VLAYIQPYDPIRQSALILSRNFGLGLISHILTDAPIFWPGLLLRKLWSCESVTIVNLASNLDSFQIESPPPHSPHPKTSLNPPPHQTPKYGDCNQSLLQDIPTCISLTQIALSSPGFPSFASFLSQLITYTQILGTWSHFRHCSFEGAYSLHPEHVFFNSSRVFACLYVAIEQ